MKRYEVTEEQIRTIANHGWYMDFKEIPEGERNLTRESLRPYFHELSVRIQNRSETELDDYEEHLLDGIFGKPSVTENP